MNPLIAKEIRLLLPAFVMALALAVIPVWLLPNDGVNSAAKVALYPFCFGVVMLALSAFGREFGLQTFSLLLAQPVERGLIWRMKISVLSLATATVFAAWYLSCASCGYLAQSGPGYDWISLSWQISRTVGVDPKLGQTVWSETLIIGGTIMAVTFAGGLWTTLLLRQVAGAFWFTVLIPAAITMVIELSGGPDWMLIAALVLYSAAGFSFARWQFLRAQDAAWTGDVISFPGRQSGALAMRSRVRAHRPLAALFQKELQLHQVGLIGLGGLFLLHLVVVAMRKAGAHAFSPTVFSALQVFGGIWLLVPLLVAAPSVAEERKLGTFDGLICLPVRNRIQFAVKLCFVMAVGGLLSAVLFWTAEGIGGVIGAGCDIPALREPFSGHALALLCLISFGLSLIGFHASTLAHGMVQSLAAGVVAACGVWVLGVMASDPLRAFGIYDSPAWLWQGALVHYIGWPTLTGAFLWLAWRNFKTGAERGRLWRRNTLGLTGALVFIAGATNAVYHRGWELVTPLEPSHGPARLTEPANVHSYGGSGLGIVLLDGRLWADRIAYDPGELFLSFGEEVGFRLGGKLIGLGRGQMVPGSNWVDAIVNFRETVAIRSDGSLWVSEKPCQPWEPEKGRPPLEEAAPLVRFGDETNWQSVVRDIEPSVILLKKDGSLWNWGATNAYNEKKSPGLREFHPQRLGAESDWARLISAGRSAYAWKRDGRAWVLNPVVRTRRKQEVAGLEGLERIPAVDNTRWRSLAQCWLRWPWHIGVREDGTLWAWTLFAPASAASGQGLSARMVQLGKDTDWSAAGGGIHMAAALKADGSLWAWFFEDVPRDDAELTSKSPVRLGTHNDWVALGNVWGGAVSLAADGSLWYWRNPRLRYDSDQPMLASSRKPALIGNIFAAQK